MATAEQLKSLLKSHFEMNSERFNTVALQIAANEAKNGHVTIANEIKELVEKNKKTPVKIIELTPDLQDLINASSPDTKISELFVNESIKNRLERVLKEYIQRNKLQKFGLKHRRKLLLSGLPGTGKTMTASVLAGELNLPLYTVVMDKMITRYMGETSAKLRQIFNFISKNRGIYLFDEFDAIGAERGMDNEVGEMRRVLNSFLQFIEQDTSESFIIAATNNINILDQALFRRFDDVIHYLKPDSPQANALISNRLGMFVGKLQIKNIIDHALGLSHAEIAYACDDAIKEAILSDKEAVNEQELIKMLDDRKMAYGTHLLK